MTAPSRVHRISVGAALAIGGAFAGLLALGQAPEVIRRIAQGDLIDAIVIPFGPPVVFIALLARWMFTVRVSTEGIGAARRAMSWSAINEVELRNRWLLSALHIRSVYKPTVIVHRSIARSPDFARDLEACGAPSVVMDAVARLQKKASAGEVSKRGPAK